MKDTETGSSNSNKEGLSKINKKSVNKLVDETLEQTNEQNQTKPNNFGVNYGNRMNIKEMPNG